MSRLIAAREWIPDYDPSWLGRDVAAGLSVAAVLIPSALAYSSIVGVDPIVGLYTVPLALVAYAILGGSRRLVVGADAAISVLAASTVAVVVADGAGYVDAVITVSLIVGVLYVAMYLLRMGWVADLIPEPVVLGFIQGLVWVTILGQVPKLLGLEVAAGHAGFFAELRNVVEAAGTIDGTTALLGIGSLLLLVGLRVLTPGVPGVLVVLTLSMVVVGVLSLADAGVTVVGEPSGPLLDLGLPTAISAGHVLQLVPGALAIVVLGFTESMGAAQSAATGEHLDPDRELFALGCANLGAGLSGGYVVTGALSKTSVAITAGAHTQVGNLVAAVIGAVSLVVLRPVFDLLSLTVLAAIVVYAMAGMADVRFFRQLWRINRSEFAIASISFAGVLVLGVLPGVVAAVIAAITLVIHHVGRPPSYELGRTPAGDWLDAEAHPDATREPGLVVWRQDGPLLFLNARRFCNTLRELADAGAQVIVVDASATSGVDSTGVRWFAETVEELAGRGVEVWVVAPIGRPYARAQRAAATLDVTLPRILSDIDEALVLFRDRSAPAGVDESGDRASTQEDPQ